MSLATVKFELHKVALRLSFCYFGNVMCNNNISVDLSVKKNIQVIRCQGITARTKGNANWRMLLSHLEKKLCIGFLLLLQIGNEKKYKG